MMSAWGCEANDLPRAGCCYGGHSPGCDDSLFFMTGGGRQRRSWRARAALVEALGIERYDNPSSAAKLVLLQAQPGAVLADVSPGEHMCMVLSALLGLLACPDLEVQVYNEIAVSGG